MNTRRTMLVANWKMNKTVVEAVGWLNTFYPQAAERAAQQELVEVAVCAPFTVLHPLYAALRRLNSKVKLGAQDIFWQERGAFTGEISAEMLQEFQTKYVICGHSERRVLLQESSEIVSRKCAAAMKAGITPIVCVGESISVRRGGLLLQWLEAQLYESLAFWDNQETIVVAYEPVWAIGTGQSATAADAEQACGYIRQVLRERAGDAADYISILYGGGVTPENIGELLDCPNVDGALVGGASLDPDAFGKIVLDGCKEPPK